MNVLDFITQEELDELPEDEHLAFSSFVRHAQRRLAEATNSLDDSDQYQWRVIEEWRYDFMNVVLAAAKKWAIEPFATMDVPTLSNFDDNQHRQFKADLDFYMTQLVLDTVIRDRKDSVHISATAKERIRNHLHELRKCVDQAELSESRRDALLKKLADFEAALDKQRLSLLAVTRVTFEILMIPGGLWASQQIATKLITNVLQTVAEEKAVDDAARQLPSAPPQKLIAPRKATPETTASRRPIPAAFDTDLDDDVPF